MEAFNFTVANEDTNLYSYDMRKMDIAACNTLGANIVEIFYNEGSTPGTDFNTDLVYSGAPYHFKVDDLDGDADMDMIIIDDMRGIPNPGVRKN